MSTLEDFLLTINPKIAKTFKVAQDVESVRLPLASRQLTRDLNGGIGKGRMAMIYGNNSAGKSALVMQSIGLWQQAGEVCVYVDTEGTWDNDWAKRLGVDTSELILIQSKSGARIYDQVKPLLEAGVGVVVIDSISMILSDEFIDDDGNAKGLMQQRQMGAQSKAISRLINAMHFSNTGETAIILISQTTTEIGQTYTKQVPTGGKKPLFACSQIIKLTSSNTDAKQIKGSVYVSNRVIDTPVGRKVDTTVEKNKLGPQGKASTYDFYYEGDFVGIDSVGEVIDEAVKYGVIKKGGAWFNKGDLKWQGRDNLVAHYRSLPDDLEELDQEVEDVKSGTVRQEA